MVLTLPPEPVNLSPFISTTFAEYRFLVTEPKSSEWKASDVDFRSPLTKFNARDGQTPDITLNLPIISAAMQSVSGVRMATALALEGGIADIYCSQSVESQAEMVRAVKRTRAGFQTNVVAIRPDASVDEAQKLIEQHGYSNLAVTQDGSSNGIFLGLISETRIKDFAPDRRVSEAMLEFKREALEHIIDSMSRGNAYARTLIRTVRDYVPYSQHGVTLEQANDLLKMHGVRLLPIIGNDNHLESMVFARDIDQHLHHPLEVVDSKKRLLAAAAINTKDYESRVPALIAAGADILFIDASNGLSDFSAACLEFMRKEFPDTPIVAGNYITQDGFRFAVEHGAWAVKVGIGGGSICITQEQKGIGRGQATATAEVVRARNKHYQETGVYIPVISDGGIVHAKDILMAYAHGADFVMQGRWFAGMDESPTPVSDQGGMKVKPYWGEGSARARNWQRYDQNQFEEGVEGVVPYVGSLAPNLLQQFSKIRATMADLRRRTITELHERPVSIERISMASLRESGVHDLLGGKSGDLYSDSLGTFNQPEWGMGK